MDYYLSIKKITIISADNDKNIRGSEKLIGKNLLFLATDETEKALLDSNPNLKAVNIRKKYPSDLELNASFYSPIAALEVSQGYFYLAEDGKIIYKTRSNTSSFPKINYYQKLNYALYAPTETISYKDIATALFFLQRLKDLGFKVITIDINGLDMIAFNLDKKRILFTTEKDLKIQEYELGVIISQLKIQGKEFETLDLRFSKPVIKF